jgi:hypothetical protein
MIVDLYLPYRGCRVAMRFGVSTVGLARYMRIKAANTTERLRLSRKILALRKVVWTPVPHVKSENVRPARRLTIEATVNV